MTSPAERIRAFYADYHRRMGNTSGWPHPTDGRRLYAAACADPALDWSTVRSVLDVGSGEGGLLTHLRSNGFEGAYLGVELLDRCHRRALETHRDDRAATFMRADFEQLELPPGGFDWVFSLGSLAVRQPDQARCDRTAINRIVRCARIGVVVYVNDASRMPPAWMTDLTDLAAHDLGAICELLAEAGCPARNVRWYDGDHSAVIHALCLRSEQS